MPKEIFVNRDGTWSTKNDDDATYYHFEHVLDRIASASKDSYEKGYKHGQRREAVIVIQVHESKRRYDDGEISKEEFADEILKCLNL